MSGSLPISRRQLAHGTGQTTQRNKRLPFTALAVQIPARTGSVQQGSPAVVTLPACLSSPWRPNDAYKVWWPSPSTLVSSDGVWRLKTAAMKRVLGMTGAGSIVVPALDLYVNFASPTQPAELKTPDTGRPQILEDSYESREWYPAKHVFFRTTGLSGSAQRLKSIRLKQDGYTFTWRFAKADDVAVTYTEPTCVNRDLIERATTTRVYAQYNNPSAEHLIFRRLANLTMSSAAGVNQGRFLTGTQTFDSRIGFLQALELNISFYETSGNTYTDQYNATDLSRMTVFGQPRHGLHKNQRVYPYDGGPSDYFNVYNNPPSGCTRYFKSPDAPGPPAPGTMPASFYSLHYSYLDDVVLNAGKRYAAQSDTLALTAAQWLHAAADGIVRVLGVVKIFHTSITTTFEIHNYGPVKLRVGSETYTSIGILGTVTLTSDDGFTDTLERTTTCFDTWTGGPDPQTWGTNFPGSPGSVGVPTAGGSPDTEGYPVGHPGELNARPVVQSPKVKLNSEIFVEASPDGRQIVLMRGIFGMQNKHEFWWPYKYCRSVANHTILTVAEINVWEDLTVSEPAYKFQWTYPQVNRADTFSVNALFIWASRYVSMGTWWVKYNVYAISTTGVPYTQQECVGYAYAKSPFTASGYPLTLATIDYHYAPYSWFGGQPRTALWDSGILAADAPPTTGPYGNLGDSLTEITLDDYPVNGGIGWYLQSCTLSAYPDEEHYFARAYRATNNLILYEVFDLDLYAVEPADVVHLVEHDLVATPYPTDRETYAALWPTATEYTKYCSYDPRTRQIAGQNDNLGPLSWI